jgi:integrase
VARPRWQTGWLFQRGKRNPVWVGRYREDFLKEDGSRLRRERSVILGPVRDLGKREAQRLLAEQLAGINQGKRKPEMIISFERFVLDRWEPNLYPILRFLTVRNYRYIVRTHLLPFFGSMRLPEISPADVQIFLSQKAKKLAPRSVLSLRNRLLKIFGSANKWGYLESNPAQGTEVPALVDTRDRRTLTPEQVRRLLAALAEPYRTMLLLAVLSGLRRGEILGLRWKAVDFEDRSVLVSESNFEGHAVPVKTRASRRKVFVDAVLVEALAALRPERYQPEDFVFASETGTALHPTNVQRRVLNPAGERAGIPRVSWHNFRYTYSTWADPSGESIKALQAQLGHTDSKLTLSVYTQPMPKAQKQVARKVAGVLLPNAPKIAREPRLLTKLVQ